MIQFYLHFKYGKSIYDTDQGAGNWKHIAGKAAALIAVIAGLLHFKENPTGISIFIIPLVLLILLYNHESIIVFNDRFVYVPAFFKPWKKPYTEFLYKHLEGTISPVEYEVENLPNRQDYLNKVDSRTKMHVLYKDRTSFLFSTSIPWPYMQMAAKQINQKIEKNSKMKSR